MENNHMSHDKPREGKLCDCTSQYCKHYKSNYDKFVEEANKQPQPSGEGWEMRFDKQFPYESLCCNGDYCKDKCHDNTREKLFSFIRSLVSEAEARAREDLIDSITTKAGELRHFSDCKCHDCIGSRSIIEFVKSVLSAPSKE